jgi:hypothetical protein
MDIIFEIIMGFFLNFIFGAIQKGIKYMKMFYKRNLLKIKSIIFGIAIIPIIFTRCSPNKEETASEINKAALNMQLCIDSAVILCDSAIFQLRKGVGRTEIEEKYFNKIRNLKAETQVQFLKAKEIALNESVSYEKFKSILNKVEVDSLQKRLNILEEFGIHF